MTRFELSSAASPHPLTWMSTSLFDEAECERIVDSWDETAASAAGAGGEVTAARVADQMVVPHDGTGWPIVPILDRVADVNRQVFRIDLTEIPDDDQPVLLRYSPGTGHYRAHVDLGPGAWGRKLSFVVLLSDEKAFEGGDLRIGLEEERVPLRRGSMAVFPSYVTHSVDLVTSGERFVASGWVHGPSFR